jgi:hypothetical protein
VGNAFLTAKLSDTVLAPQSSQDNPDLLFR